MNKFFNLILLASAISTLAACDAASSAFADIAGKNEPTSVIGPGYMVMIESQNVPISGFDACPKSDPVMSKLFGSASYEDSNSCIVLSKERTHVQVQFPLEKKVLTEQWEIVRNSGTRNGRYYSEVRLLRPNGATVGASRS